ncbi:MAG: hypothetical protein LKK08_06110 [Bacteroidales bacterium]|jgi:hypothetical protein|nr:hypothetical protein [Bacteroidales bacterium]
MQEQGQDYKADIIATRKGGLGSSDAKMVVKIGRTRALSYSDQERLAQMLGITERKQFTTPATRYGDYIENRVFEAIKTKWPEAVSNPYYKSDKLSAKYGFDVFDHIDYEMEDATSIVWIENKATVHSLKETIGIYDAQLRWHYMLVNEKAAAKGKTPYLYLTHYWVEPDKLGVFDAGRLSITPLSIGSGYDADIQAGLQYISEAIKDFHFTPREELEANDLPEPLQNAMAAVSDKLRLLSSLEAEVDDFKSKLLPLMEENKIRSIKNDMFAITYKAPYQSARFDSRNFQKDHIDLYNEYLRTSTVKSSVVLKINQK